MIDTFEDGPETRWRFFTDGVMGGVSQGGVAFLTEGPDAFARMEGRVSTANNGGFIQIRRDLETAPPGNVTSVRLVQRGNGERYFVHLRTTASAAPWQYFRAGFQSGPDWSAVTLPLADFAASGQLMRPLHAAPITSIAVVAYGRDHDARIEIREIGFA